jgi:hypothetical protein
MALLISNAGSSIGKHKSKMDMVKETMNNLGLPRDLQKRIYNYYEYLWDRHGGADSLEMFEDISQPLRSEIFLYLHADDLQKVELFMGCEARFIVRVVGLFEAKIFLPGDYIIVKGTIGKELFFLRKGRCSVILGTGENIVVVKELSEGESFG